MATHKRASGPRLTAAITAVAAVAGLSPPCLPHVDRGRPRSSTVYGADAKDAVAGATSSCWTSAKTD